MALTGQLVTLIAVLVPPSPAAISSSTNARVRESRPAPPRSSGTQMP
jgi:hypothetical protein